MLGHRPRYADEVPNWDDPDDPGWRSLATRGMTRASLMELGDATFGAHDGLTTGQRVDRGIASLQDKGYVIAAAPQVGEDDAGVVVYTFVRRVVLRDRDPVTRWGARLIIVAVAAFALWHAVQVMRFFFFVVS